jgi:hypothetical protein
MLIDMDRVKQQIDIIRQEIEVFENHQDPHIGKDAQRQEEFSFPPVMLSRDPDACEIIYNNGKEEDKDIDRLKEHIKETAGQQEQDPPEPVG